MGLGQLIHASPEKKLLSVDPTATVADVMATKDKDSDEFRFQIPTCPEFTSRYFWQIAPWKMKSYKTEHTTEWGTISTATLIRFIKTSDVLFDDASSKQSYKNALAGAIDAHKNWFSNPSEANLARLNAQEKAVEAFLQTLDFSNPFNRKRLEKLLTTPQKGILKSFFHLFSLGNAIKFVSKDDKNTKSLFKTPKLGALYPVGFGIAKFLITLILIREKSPLADFPCLMVAILLAFQLLRHFKNDTNLTPEVGNGVKIKIEVDYGSYSHEYPNAPF